MATYDTIVDNKFKAGAFIGKQLIALQDVTAKLDSVYSTKLRVYKKGSVLGNVYGIVQPAGANQIWWYFQNPDKKTGFYVLHDPKKVGMNAIDLATVKTVDDYIDEKKTEAEKESKGTFAYYFERYGKVLLFTGAGIATVYIIAKNHGTKN